MQEILEVSCRPVHDGIWTPAELMGALERAATDHADALNIGHDLERQTVAEFVHRQTGQAIRLAENDAACV